MEENDMSIGNYIQVYRDYSSFLEQSKPDNWSFHTLAGRNELENSVKLRSYHKNKLESSCNVLNVGTATQL